jgi:hypothetical protein
MHNASTPTSTLTSTLITVRALVRDINPATLTDEQIALLYEVANFALSNAQEARLGEESQLDEIERFEEEESARFVCDPDTREDRFLDSHWESLTDVGDIGGGDF